MNLELIKQVAEFKGILNKFVYLRKDEKGYYLEYAFLDIPVPHNRCLSWYIKGYESETQLIKPRFEVDKLHELVSFTCSKDSGCEVGKPALHCDFGREWTYDQPHKCACWHLDKDYEYSLSLSFKQLENFLK